MKKLLIIFAILFATNCKAQDTTYYQKRDNLYMMIRSEVKDTTLSKRFYINEQRRKRSNRVWSIVAGVIWGSITGWYLMKP